MSQNREIRFEVVSVLGVSEVSLLLRLALCKSPRDIFITGDALAPCQEAVSNCYWYQFYDAENNPLSSKKRYSPMGATESVVETGDNLK